MHGAPQGRAGQAPVRMSNHVLVAPTSPALLLLLDPSCGVQDNVFVVMVVSVQYQVMGGNLYDAFYRVSGRMVMLQSACPQCLGAYVLGASV